MVFIQKADDQETDYYSSVDYLLFDHVVIVIITRHTHTQKCLNVHLKC